MVVELRGLKPGWLLYYIFGIYHLNRFRKKKKETMNRMKVQETPRTEARMASLLYI